MVESHKAFPQPEMRRIRRIHFVGIGAGEAAFFIAEKFALHQIFRNGAAVYCDKGAACAL